MRNAVAFVVVLLVLLLVESTELPAQCPPQEGGMPGIHWMVRGVVEGPVFDVCGEFIICPVDSLPPKSVYLRCALPPFDSYPWWENLVGYEVIAWGWDEYVEDCPIVGVGSWVFCVDWAEPVPTVVEEVTTWGGIKMLYRE